MMDEWMEQDSMMNRWMEQDSMMNEWIDEWMDGTKDRMMDAAKCNRQGDKRYNDKERQIKRQTTIDNQNDRQTERQS